MFMLRVGLWMFILLLIGGGLLWFRGFLSNVEFGLWLALVVPASWLIAAGVWILMDGIGAGFIRVLTSSAGTPPEYSFSAQQALVVQWKYAEAEASYRKYIDDHPGEIEGRLRLAEMLAGPAQDPAGAEEMFMEARILGGTPQQDATLSNGLIDLYTATGRTDALKAELERFTRTYPGSSAAAKAEQRRQALTDSR